MRAVVAGAAGFLCLASLCGCSSEPSSGFQPTETPTGAGGSTTGSGGGGASTGSGTGGASTGAGGATGGAGAAGGATSGGATSGSGGASAGGAASGSGGAATSGAGGGDGGTGGGGAGGPERSAGCGVAPTQALEEYVQYTLTPSEVAAACNLSPPVACEAAANLNVAADADGVARTDREYFVRLPAGYDPNVPYRLVYLAPGCYGQAEEKIYALQNVDMGEAILVTMQFVGTPDDPCFDDFIVDSPDFPFIEAMQRELDQGFCFDRKRVFFGGYSSGSWLANSAACLFGGDGGFIRAIGAYTGGLPPYLANGEWTCAPGATPGMFVHDSTDMTNPIGGPTGGAAARDRLLQANGCSGTATEAYTLGSSAPSQPCARYTGCPADYPVVWCETTGVAHDDANDALVIPAFWTFFSQFE